MALPPLAVQAQNVQQTSSIATSGASQKPGKSATRTEIVADLGQSAMLTSGSIEAMQNAVLMYEEIVAGGGWPAIDAKKIGKGMKGPAVIMLRQRLITENYLPFDSLSSDTADVFDDEMMQAVKAFQINHGVTPTGTVGEKTLAELNVPAERRLAQLKENLPRVAAYLEGLGSRAILVNIPAAQLETVENGQVYSRHNVVAGKLDRPSPSLMSTVSDINFNPYWTVPASIVEKDIIPKYLQDPSYLQQMNMRIFDGVDGPEIDPASVDWSITPPERYVFRQEPGEHNALGTVKINFPNKFMVYMHDTPHRELFNTNTRFESSGCIRVDQVKDVVNWILRGQDGFNQDEYDSIVASREYYSLKVQDPPDVRFMYLTAWATEDGAVNFRPDVYGLDGTGFIQGQPESQTY